MSVTHTRRQHLSLVPPAHSMTPFEVEREFDRDETQLVTLHMSEAARADLVAALVKNYMTDLVLLARLTHQRRNVVAGSALARELHVEIQTITNRLVGNLGSRGTCTWEMSQEVANDLAQELEAAATDAQVCDIGTCTSPAQVSGMCAAHGERG